MNPLDLEHRLPSNSAAQGDAFRSALNAPPSAPGRER
jgi:hypothetical protein